MMKDVFMNDDGFQEKPKVFWRLMQKGRSALARNVSARAGADRNSSKCKLELDLPFVVDEHRE